MVKWEFAALAATVLLALNVAGCATITRGTEEEVRFVSDPPGASVSTSTSNVCSSTPCTLKISRKSSFTATASKPGYRPLTIDVKSEMAGAGAVGMAGNLVIGGIGGIVVDAATGATLSHNPNPVLFALVPVNPRNKSTPPGSLERLQAAEDAKKKKPKPTS